MDEGLVKLMDGLLKDKLQKDKVQTRIEKYPRPGNVKGSRTPRVNPLIWSQIPVQAHTSDSKSQKSQNALVASIVAMIKETNLRLSPKIKIQGGRHKTKLMPITPAIKVCTKQKTADSKDTELNALSDNQPRF